MARFLRRALECTIDSYPVAVGDYIPIKAAGLGVDVLHVTAINKRGTRAQGVLDSTYGPRYGQFKLSPL